MPLCNSTTFALHQWLIHGVDGNQLQYRQVLMKSMFTTTSCQRQFLKWSSWPTSAWRIRLCSSDAWEGRRKARMRLSMPSWYGICGPSRDLLALKWWSYQHIWLQPALLTMELSPSWLFYAKWDARLGVLRSPTDVQLEDAWRVRKAEVKAGRKQKYRRKLLGKRRKCFEDKAVEAKGQTYEPGAFWPQFLWVTCVFLKLKLLCFLEECGSLRARWLSNHSLWTHESTYFLYLWSNSWCLN